MLVYEGKKAYHTRYQGIRSFKEYICIVCPSVTFGTIYNVR